MMTPIQSGGEAMPITSIARRNFLRGAAAAVTLPTVSLASPRASGGDTIASLVSQHTAAKDAVDTATAFALKLWKVPDRVEPAFVAASEFSPLVYSVSGHAMVGDRCITLEQVNHVVDYYVEDRKRFYNWQSGGDGENPVKLSAVSAARLADSLAMGESDRVRATAIYKERDAARKAWEVRSGVADADAECDRLFAIADTLNDRIFAFECRSVEDVRIKAAWLIQEHGDELSPEASFKVLTQFAAIGQEARG